MPGYPSVQARRQTDTQTRGSAYRRMGVSYGRRVETLRARRVRGTYTRGKRWLQENRDLDIGSIAYSIIFYSSIV